MNKRIKAFLVGMGSAVSIYPATNYANFVPRATPEERMRGHWEQTGRQLRSAMDEVGQHEQTQKAS